MKRRSTHEETSSIDQIKNQNTTKVELSESIPRKK